MDQVIIFDKSLQQRLQEYNDILSGYDQLPASALNREWSFYLELTVDPIGWQAIWKIPRATCEALKISFPSIVLVLVLNVDFKELVALVRVFAVQGDIHIPEKHYVPLTQLWPTKEQDKSIGLNLQSTANALDIYRFFYNYIFMPWDKDDDETGNWVTTHLATRLRLHYDLKNMMIPRATGEHIHSLVTEAKRLQSQREFLENDLSEDEDLDLDKDNKNLQQLTEIHVRLMEIKSQMKILENPMLRKVIINRQSKLIASKSNEDRKIWLIFDQGIVDDYINFLSKVKSDFPNESVSFSPSLANQLEVANSNDVYILNEGEHEIRTTGALETGGILKGIGDPAKTVLTSNMKEVLFDFIGGNVLLENITIDASLTQCAIVVRRGKGVLRNCSIYGNGESSTQQAIVVLAGAELEMINCKVTKFSVAIIGNSETKITLRDSEIFGVHVGLKIYDNCSVKAEKVTIRDCRDFGIVVETDNSLENCDGKTVGDFETLNIVPKMETNGVNGENNGKGNVVINLKSKITPFTDIFKGDSDPTIIEFSEDEMETSGLDKTVIENDLQT